MTQVWSRSQQVLLDYPIVLDFNTRAPNQTLLVGEKYRMWILYPRLEFLIWKKKAYDLYTYFGPWFLVVVNQPSHWSQVPLKFFSRFSMWQASGIEQFSRKHPFHTFGDFMFDLVIDFFLRLVSSVFFFLLWQIFWTWVNFLSENEKKSWIFCHFHGEFLPFFD